MQHIKYIKQMINMFIQALTIDLDIIKIHNYEFTYECTQHMIYQSYKYTKCICKSKRND
jgi:hypothetical protein